LSWHKRQCGIVDQLNHFAVIASDHLAPFWRRGGKAGAPVNGSLFLAGLDTVAGQSSYMWLHLATYPPHRQRIVDDPASIPHAVEELMRAFPVVQIARKAIRDAHFHGRPVKKGDVALFPTAAASRDDRAYPHARTVDFDRGVIRHLSFGAGPHRCLGSPLARQGLAVLLQEWHRLIPDYDLLERPTEHAPGVENPDSRRSRCASFSKALGDMASRVSSNLSFHWFSASASTCSISLSTSLLALPLSCFACCLLAFLRAAANRARRGSMLSFVATWPSCVTAHTPRTLFVRRPIPFR
jgi:Cytochrome P450